MCLVLQVLCEISYKAIAHKGKRAFADLRYLEKDILSPSALMFAAKKSLLGIYTLYLDKQYFICLTWRFAYVRFFRSNDSSVSSVLVSSKSLPFYKKSGQNELL